MDLSIQDIQAPEIITCSCPSNIEVINEIACADHS
jgi:hypothetical protein